MLGSAFPVSPRETPDRRSVPAQVDVRSDTAHAYHRIKEFLHCTIDDIVSRPSARDLVRDLFGLHLSVRDPGRLNRLPQAPQSRLEFPARGSGAAGRGRDG